MRTRTTKLKLGWALSGAVSVMAAGAVLTAGAAAARAETPAMQKTAEVIHSTATVSSIDKKTRTVTLKKEDGDLVAVEVPPDMPAFDRLAPGDHVDVDYYEAVAVSMLPPGAGKPAMTERVTHSRGMGKGMATRETTASAEVIAVDPSANTVTFKGPRGQVHTVAVHDPELQTKLKTLKAGQTVQITYSEAVAATIRPKGSMTK